MLKSDQAHPTLHAGPVRGLYETLLAEGLDAEALFNEFNIPLTVCSDPSVRVEVLKVKTLWSEVTRLTNNDAISLKVGQHIQGGGTNLAVLGGASENLLDAANNFTRFLAAANTGLAVKLQVDDCFRAQLLPTASGVHVGIEFMDFLMSRITQLVAAVTYPSINPKRIELKRPTPICEDAFHDFFKCPLFFNQENDAIYFSLEDAKQPFTTRNEHLATHMQTYLKKYIETHVPSDTQSELVKKIVQHLPSLLAKGKPSIADVASHLHMSQRTLQRKLKDSQVNFQTLLNDLRFDLACHYLKQGETSIEALAQLLGFSSHSSFNRFFKGASGLSPKDFSAHNKTG